MEAFRLVFTFLASPGVMVAAVFFPLTFLLIKIFRLWIVYQRTKKTLSQFPCPPRHWLYGTLKDFRMPDHMFLEQNVNFTSQYKTAYVQWLGPFWGALVVCHPDTVKSVLKSMDPKGAAYSFIKPWLGDGLLTSRGEKWSRNRRLLTSAFHFDILKPYVRVYNQATDIFMSKIDEVHRNGSVKFPVFRNVSLLTLDIILKCAFSLDANCQTIGTHHPYIKAVFKLSSLVAKRQFNLLHLTDFFYYLSDDGRMFTEYCKKVHKESEFIITKRRKALRSGAKVQETAKKYQDFLDILLTTKDTDGSGLSDEEIREEVDTFLFEGHDTTASGISWTIYILAKYPDHQEQCRKEVNQILESRTSSEILWSDLGKLKHLTQCIKETLRLYPPVSYISRSLIRDVTVDGKRVAAGTNIQIPIYNIHHNPDVWKDHMDFKPERFDSDSIRGMDPFSYIPFSAGPRNCIGQNFALNEEKVILSRLLNRFRWRLSENEEPLPYFQMVLKFHRDLQLEFTPLSQSNSM